MGEEDVLERKKVVEGEYVPLGSRLWLGGADCMIATLCNIMTGGGLTFFLCQLLWDGCKVERDLLAVVWDLECGK